MAKWKETRKTAWFVAAIVSATKENTAQLSALFAEAERLKADSPAYLTVAYHQIRLLLETGKTAEADAKLNAILADKSLTNSAYNQFAAQKMKTATTLDEFLTFAQRRPASFTFGGGAYYPVDLNEKNNKGEFYYAEERLWVTRTMFDTDGLQILNGAVPFEILRQIAVSPKLPKHLQRDVLIAVWTRAVVLGDDVTASAIAPVLVKTAPEFQPNFAEYLEAKTAAERKNSAIYLLLKTPALRIEVESGFGRRGKVSEIDNFRDNWWCAPNGVFYDEKGNEITLEPLTVPLFLNQTQFAAAQKQRQNLKSLGNAPNWLAQEAINFAVRAPKDPRVPEALHLAVAKATRFGCVDKSVSKFSKAAYDLLRKNYPRSEWTKKTPYWYKGN